MISEVATKQPRLLANVIDAKAESIPDEPWLLYANSSNWEQEGGYQTITWKQFANAINKAAFWLDENLPQTEAVQTVSYVGPNDPRYYIIIAAATKSKRRIFIPDGRITPDGITKILNEIQCNAWITTQDRVDNSQGILNTIRNLKVLVIPSLEYFVRDESNPTPSYPYEKTWEQVKDDVVCIIHTSGTTGVPKPIYLRNGFMSAWDSWNIIFERHRPRNLTYDHMIGAQTLTACGPQWLAGLAFCLNAAAFIGMTTVMLPPDMTLPLDRSKIIKICQQTGARSLITPPSLIEDFHNDKASFDFLKDLDFVCYLGAALDHRVGDSLAQQTHLFPVIGSTERGMMLSFESDDTNAWKSYEFVPEMGARFEPVTEEFYELHVDRIPEHDFFQGGFYTFPDLESIATDELYSLLVDKYGTKRWVSCGRKDDLVKLAWLAKFHATDIENAIARHPRVRSVFVGGEGRDVPFIIIEPLENEALSSTDQEKFVEEIYNSAINDVNEGSEAIQIPREMVMLSDPAQPFKRSMKMTIMRKEVEKAYKDHIEALYARWEATKSNGHVK